ncbi:MAG: hypothetical protein DDT19_02437 [Syntrophomonadaceae bacterium]|nr:hypothetical protein [Bacillota bacterium]
MNQKFEHSILEADIERLSKEIAEKRELLEYENLSERELIKKSLEPMIRQQPPVGGQQSNVSGQMLDVNSQILPDYLKDSPLEIKLQVEKLINLVFHHGIIKVSKEAQKSGGFVLDAFHDALTDKLHEKLKKRKLI